MNIISLKGSLVAAIAVLGCMALVPACSSNDQTGSTKEVGSTGSVGLNLITNGVELDRVEFVVSGPESRSGSINVDDSNATISAFIGSLLAGPGYTIELRAFNDGVQICSGTSMPFTVSAGATASVGVGLNCGASGPSRGNISVNGQVVSCPQITSVFVGPLQTSVGSALDVSVAASAAMAGFAWTGSPGSSFVNPTAASTTYTCTTAGTNLITVTMTAGTCAAESISTEVNCVGTGGGSGGSGGSGGAAGGSAGAPAAGAPAGGAPAGGAPAGGTAGTAGTGGADACTPCLGSNCSGPVEFVATQCTGTTCDPLRTCFAGSTCDEEDPRICYCGTVPFTDCLSSFNAALPNGPCKSQIEALLVPAFAPVNIPQLVAPFLLETTNPVGANFQLAICQTRECSGQCN